MYVPSAERYCVVKEDVKTLTLTYIYGLNTRNMQSRQLPKKSLEVGGGRAYMPICFSHLDNFGAWGIFLSLLNCPKVATGFPLFFRILSLRTFLDHICPSFKDFLPGLA